MGCSNSRTVENTKIEMNKNDSEEYFIHQFNTVCLAAQFSYYLESNNEAIIIDPIRDPEIYLEMLQQRGAKLKYILETHFHEDFVSGHVELNKLKGIPIVFGPTAKPDFDAKIAKDEELLPLGKINIKVIHTPGHTMESSCFLLLDSNQTPKVLFTGDCVLLGEVGRPDLAVKSEMSERDSASLLYDSIQKLKKLPDDVTIYPGHGLGSACGKKVLQGTSCSVGVQKKNNYALNDYLNKEQFIDIVTKNLSSPPEYFLFNAILNKKGYGPVDGIVKQSLNPISPNQFFKIISEHEEYVVIDSRDFALAIKSFLRGSYIISLKMQYAIWIANLFTPEHKFIVIADLGKEKESIVRLARVGYESVIGYVEGGYEALYEHCKKEGILNRFVSLNIPDLAKIKDFLETNKNTKNVEVLDVRENFEWESTGVIKNSHLISLRQLEQKADQLLKDVGDKSIGTCCKTGGRGSIAASILAKKGANNLTFLGGFLNMQEQKVELMPWKENH